MNTVLITGAGSGIGAAIALRFARAATTEQLILIGRNEKNLLSIKQQCIASGTAADYFICDLSIEQQVSDLKIKILEKHNIPDVIVNNAGRFDPTPLSKSSSTLFQELYYTNVCSAYWISQLFLQDMLARRSGDIFFIASVASTIAPEYCGVYTTTKHALLGLARGLRTETKAHGVRVMTLLPGATWTDSWRAYPAPIEQERLMPAADIAETLYQCQQLSSRTVLEEIILRPQLGDVFSVES